MENKNKKNVKLGSDGKYHTKLHDCIMQEIVIPIPISQLLENRCNKCGTEKDYLNSKNAYSEYEQNDRQ